MVVGILQMELYLPDSHSLKEKRSVLKRIEARLRNKHNVSVAEIGEHDKWGRARIAIVNVSNSSTNTNRILQSMESFIEKEFPVQVINQNIETI